MLKLLKYLKKSIVPILIIVILLFVQAFCDLSLPDYTSRIVNVGIQQGGIESPVPEVIRQSQMEKLLLFVSGENRQTVLDHYELVDRASLTAEEYNTLVKRYPALADEPLYALQKVTAEERQQLETLVEKPMLIVAGMDSGSEQAVSMKDQILAQLPESMQGQELDLFTVLAQLPQEARDQMNATIDEKFSAMPDSILSQSAINYLQQEYNAIGMDMARRQSNYILLAGAKMLGIALLSMAATILVGLLASRTAAALGQELRGRVFRKVVSFSPAEMDRFSTASLITRSTNDIQQIQMLMVMLLRIVFYAPIVGVGGVIKVLSTNASMAWIIAVAVAAILALVLVMFSVAMPRFKLMQKLVDRLNLVTREILTGIPVIRAFSTQKYEEKRFDKANRDLTKTNLFVNRVMSGMMPLMMLIMNGITVLIVWNGSHGIESGAMQVGDMMAFIQYTMQIIMAFLLISTISIMLPRASVSANRIEEVLTTEPSIRDPEAPVKETGLRGTVEFRDVSFTYPEAEEEVLSHISFTAKPGETTAIIGSTGSGKSTLLNLIPRFFDVTEGQVLVDGVDVRKMSQHELHSKLGYVPQKGVLFSGTIESNLKYGRQDLSDAGLREAAEIAQAAGFIEEKPDGYGAPIAQGGSNVSGGQKQRLSIARAIATDPEVYLFDDSFSALDYKTDAALRKALRKKTQNSTVLIVAQRISTILNAEQIIVLDDGKIAGIGTHQELLQTCDVYRQIAESQLSKEELGA